jgi:hypothetical protein
MVTHALRCTSTFSLLRHAARGALAVLLLSAPVGAQPSGPTILPPLAKTADLSGPRFGVTFLSEGVIQKLKDERNLAVGPHITQFGWQLEKLFFTQASGVSMVTELVGLIGGLEQSLAIPSASWMVGVRTREGAEFGIGPNLTPAGSALVLAAGMTFRSGPVNIPVNIAVIPSKAGTRVTFLSGLSLRHR